MPPRALPQPQLPRADHLGQPVLVRHPADHLVLALRLLRARPQLQPVPPQLRPGLPVKLRWVVLRVVLLALR